MANNTKTSVPFTHEQDGIIARLVAQREGLLNQARYTNHEEYKLLWAEIYRSFCEITGRTDKTRDQIRERYWSMKKYNVGKKKLEEARDIVVAAETLLELASTGRTDSSRRQNRECCSRSESAVGKMKLEAARGRRSMQRKPFFSLQVDLGCSDDIMHEEGVIRRRWTL